MKKITLLIAFMLSLVTMGYGQTVLINPAGDGGFANGTTFAANGWTAANSANNPWVIGTAAATGSITGNAAYVSNSAGATVNYTTSTPALNYFYRDITIPAGETKIILTFNWTATGESDWDNWQVLTAPTSVTPVSSTAITGSFSSTPIPSGITGAASVGFGSPQTGVQTATLILPTSLAGTTFRLIFSWRNDDSFGSSPAAAIDNISLTSAVPGNFISIASGNWSSPSTWNLNSVPTNQDISVTIAAGHTVTSDASAQTAPTTTVNGTLTYGSSSASLAITGNLTVNSGGIVNAYNGTTGKALTVSGNLVNNGSMDFSIGSTSAGNLTLNGSAVQTVSGTGSFVNNMIRNLVFSNTNTTIPNINWQFNNISVDYNLNITNAKINLGTNKLTFGTSATSAGNTFTVTNGGFMPGGKFARWWSSSATGYTTSGPSSIATGSGGRYPFYTPEGLQRIFYIGRTTPTAGGVYAVTFNNVAGLTTGLSIVDGTYTVTDRTNSNFVVTTEGNAPAEASAWVTIFAPDAYYPINGNSRLVGQSAALSGTNVATTVLPAVQRSGVSSADLTAATGLYMGVNTADIAVTAIASGNWDSPSTWNKGAVPVCTDLVSIASGVNVTVNSTGNVAKNVTIGSMGTLTVASGDLTVGCTLKNNNFTNNGTLTVSGGTLNINGNMTHTAGSTFNQSGGDINVDGNDGGATATSVASGTAIVQVSTNLINWTGGNLTIVDPHANSTSTYSFQYSGANVDVTSGTHTLRFGNGTSTDAGGSATYGFRYYVFQGSGRLTFNNIVVNGGAGTNRFVSNGGSHGINGDLTINAGSEFRDTGNTIYLSKNLVNNGTYISTGTLYAGSLLNGTAGVSSNAQTISGTGTFANNATPASVTANLSSMNVNNTNATGVTLSLPLSLSGTLTLTAGKVNTTTANLLTVGTATAAGTVTGGSATAYVSGPLARTIASANANTNYIAFPVGKAAYAPISLAPATTAVTVMKAEAFDTNAGTMDPSIINLAANRRWEAPVVSGTVTNLNVRLGDANITATKIPVQATTAAGAYAAAFGSVATYAAGTPNTTTSNTVITTANYTGFLSFADSNSCSGTPTPGNTIASATNICQGTTVNFSVQNGTSGSGVTYQWQTSPDNGTYTDISGATSTTYSAAPTASLYYRLKVTCASGPSIGYSTPVQITFPNSVTASTGATRCGVGSAAISATPSAGASITWFDSATGSNIIGAGNNLTTPVVTATTSFYAAAETTSAGNITIGSATTLTTDTQQPTAFCNRWGGYRMQILYSAAELYAMGLRAGNITSITFNTTTAGDGLTNDNFTVSMGAATGSAIGSTTFVTSGLNVVYGPVTHTHTASGLQTITFSTPYSWNGTSGILLEVSHNGANLTNNARTYYTATTGNTILYATSLTATTGTLSTSRLNVIFAGQVGCSSARVPVTVTVNPAPALTLSGNPAVICEGNTTAPVTITSGAASYDTYTWSPSTGVSGSAATGWTFNPTTNTTYVLTATQSGGTMCAADPISVLVSVNLQPSAAISLPSALTACQQSPQAIMLTNAVGSLNATLGTGTTAPDTTSYPNPFSAFYGGTKTQILFTAEELSAQGLMPGSTINTLSFDFNASVASALNDFRIKIGTTTNTTTTAGFVASSSLTTVYNASYTPTAGTTGLVPFALTTPYIWNGGNLIVEVAHNQGNFGNGSGTTTNTTTTSFNSVYTGASDSVTPAGMTSFDALTSWSISSASTSRPNVVFGYNPNNTVVWSPVTNLYTDAAATIAYSGQSVGTVYTKLNSNATYTATVTNSLGCSRVKTVDVTVSIVAAPTVPAATQDICNAGTVADLVATGTAIKWYAAATGGTALASTTALVNGTTYYASQTVSGCESLTRTARTANITVVAAPTIANANQTFCNAGTVADLMPNDASIKWYAAATGGTALLSTDALVNGTTYYASQTVGGCEGLSRGAVTATVNVIAAPAISNDDQVFCNNATIADLLPNGAEIKWYNVATGGTALVSTDALVSGTTYYASQTVNGCEGLLRGTVTATVLVTPAPVVDNTAQVFCNTATVADLMPNDASIKWYAAATGGTPLLATEALVSGTSYFASQTIDGCEGLIRTEVTATINVTAEPTADAEQEFCGTAMVSDLTATGNAITWYDAATEGTALTVDTPLVDGTVYYAAQTIDGCQSATRVAVTAVIHNVVVDAPADVNVCTEYVLPALTSGAYYTEAGGQGVELAAGSTVTSTTTLYVYAQEGIDIVCFDENTFTVTVANVAAPTGNATQTIEGGVAADVTVADLVTDAVTGTVTWYATLEDAQAGTNALAPDTQLVQGATYYATQTIDTCTSVGVFAVTVDIVLDRGGFDVKAFSYYPNPVKDVLNLTYSSEITSVTVFNLLGQKVISQVANATDVRVDMASLADGAYIVNVTSGNTVKTVKVIKKQ